jgi:hypothetical protein
MKKTELQKAIATLLFKNSDGFSNTEIARELGIERTEAFSNLKAMLEANALEKIDKTYLISDFGVAAYGLPHNAPAKSPLEQTEKPPVKTVEPAPPKTKSPLEQNLSECEVVPAAKSNTAEKIDQKPTPPKTVVEQVEKLADAMAAVSHTACEELALLVEKKLVWVNPVVKKSLTTEIEDFETRINPNQATALHDFETKLHHDCSVAMPYESTRVNDMTDQQIKRFKNGLRGDQQDAGGHYRYQYKGINLDPFRIAQIYGVTDFALQTALKKILCAGKRGHKNLRQDLLDVRCAIDRKLEMIIEDEAAGLS